MALVKMFKNAILAGIARGDIWLAKIRSDQHGQRIYANVCLEVFLRSRGTCLLEHINLGACRPEDLPCCIHCRYGRAVLNLHGKTGVEKTGEYLTQEEDRQVGLGMLGLANLLALEGVTYKEFAEALRQHLYPMDDCMTTPEARKIVKALQQGIDSAAAVARMADMDRAFAIAPTASCSPIAIQTEQAIQQPLNWHHQSGAQLIGTALHSASKLSTTVNVETADQVGWDDYKRTVDGIMEMLNRTGLAHGYSLQLLE